MSRRFMWKSLAVALVGLSLSLLGSAAAASATLTSALLRAQDVPPGFLAPRFTVYNQFSRVMQVTIAQGRSKKQQDLFYVPPGFARDGWLQGVIEAFDTQQQTLDLRAYAWRFKTIGGARAAYQSMALPRAAMLKKKQVTVMSKAQVGNESLTVEQVRARGHDDVIFRHGVVVVEVSYLAPTSLSGASFLRLASLVNSRLG